MKIFCNRIRDTYDARAGRYDALVRMLSLGGDSEYRRQAVAALRLRPGDRVLDVGCGTGLNFRWILKAVGPAGRMVGTDLSYGMLRRALRHPNLRLVQATASRDIFKPASFDAILSTYVITTLLDQEMIAPILGALKPGGRLVIADDTLPPGWFIGPGFMARHLLKQGWPDLRGRTLRMLRPWVADLRVTHCHLGMIYIISGTKR
ncbi:MAG: methyltransferase domain-containing protein [Planctomycetes bacterium]|nr:methyltransferase domain-containing protein [Planctomycetota bacterium]